MLQQKFSQKFLFVNLKSGADTADSVDKALFSQVRGGKACPHLPPAGVDRVRTGVDRNPFAQVRGGKACPTSVGQEWDRCGQNLVFPGQKG